MFDLEFVFTFVFSIPHDTEFDIVITIIGKIVLPLGIIFLRAVKRFFGKLKYRLPWWRSSFLHEKADYNELWILSIGHPALMNEKPVTKIVFRDDANGKKEKGLLIANVN